MANTIGIGRTIPGNGGELSHPAWAKFVEHTVNAVVVTGGDVIFVGEGQGIWQGVSETAACVVFVGGDVDRLRGLLADLARIYTQDAIALTVGETQFIEPATGWLV